MQKEANVKRLLDKARTIVRMFRNSSKFTEKLQEVCGFSSATAQPDGLTPSTWIPASFGSKKHSVSWLTKTADAVFLPASGKKLEALKRAPPAFRRAYKKQQSHSTSLSSTGPALFHLTSHLSDFCRSTRYRDLAALSEMKTTMCQRCCQFLPTHSSSMFPVAVKTLVDNEDVCFKQLLHSSLLKSSSS